MPIQSLNLPSTPWPCPFGSFGAAPTPAAPPATALPSSAPPATTPLPPAPSPDVLPPDTPAPSPDSIDSLAALGFSPDTLAYWRRRGRTRLLPLQQRAAFHTGLLRGHNLIVSAPTSSGKTFVAEMAAVHQREQGRRTIFLAPTRALAEEQYAHLKQTYGSSHPPASPGSPGSESAGLRTVIATRERRRHDARILSGDYDFAVMVYEKLRAFLCADPRLLDGVGLVVADELQILGDPRRGETVDYLLTRLGGGTTGRMPAPQSSTDPMWHGHPACDGSRPQILALSGVLPDDQAPALAAWLGAEFLFFGERPVELREGVFTLADGTFRWRASNSGQQGTERIVSMESPESFALPHRTPSGRDVLSEGYYPAAEFLIEQFLAAGEQTLVFVPTRPWCRGWARRLAAAVDADPAPPEVLDELRAFEESSARRDLEECLARGIGFHHAHLPLALRRLVEREFAAGRLRVLVATSTLAQGVNLQVHNVLSVPWTPGSGAAAATDADAGAGAGAEADTAAPASRALVSLSVQAFLNQGGRAARPGPSENPFAAPFGRSILLARNESEAWRLWNRIVLMDPEPLVPSLGPTQTARMALDLIAGRAARTPDSVRVFLARTFAGSIAGTPSSHAPSFGAALTHLVSETLRELQTRGLVLVTPDGLLEATALGARTARSGLRHSTAVQFEHWCREWLARQQSGDPAWADGPHELEILALVAGSPDGEEISVGAAAGPDTRWPMALDQWRPLLDAEGWQPELAADPVRLRLFSPGGLAEPARAMLRKALLARAWTTWTATTDLEEKHRTTVGTMAALAAHLGWLASALTTLAAGTGLCPATVSRLDTLARCLPYGLPAEAELMLLVASPEDTRAVLHEEVYLLGYEPPEETGGTEETEGTGTAGDPEETAPALRLDPAHPDRVWCGDREIRLPRLPRKLLALLAQSPPGQPVLYDIIALEIYERPTYDYQTQQNLYKLRKRIETLFAAAGAPPPIQVVESHGLLLRQP